MTITESQFRALKGILKDIYLESQREKPRRNKLQNKISKANLILKKTERINNKSNTQKL